MIPKLTEVFIIREAKCPECGSEGAYVGLNDVECKNPKCRHFKGQKTSGKRSQLSIDIAVEAADLPSGFKDEFDYFESIAKKYKLKITNVVKNGPGGGWPEITFEGDRKDLEKMVKEWYSPDDPYIQQDTIEFIEDM